MTNTLLEYSYLALSSLKLFPHSISEQLILDNDFRTDYGLTIDADITFGDNASSFHRKDLYNCIKETLSGTKVKNVLKDCAGEEWELEIEKKDNKCILRSLHGVDEIIIPDFYGFSPNQKVRIDGFESEADAVNLSSFEKTKWHNILIADILSDEQVDELNTEINETPVRFEEIFRKEVRNKQSQLSSFVPNNKKYYERLVGIYHQSININEYAHNEMPKHINQLLAWRTYDGFLYALLLSSHSLNLSSIDVSNINDDELVKAYEWLQNNGDLISKLGAIEIGLSIIDKRPSIEPYLTKMIQQIRDDDLDNKCGRFKLLSALVMLVDGELSRTKILRELPPFWRRLASIAQASLIERCVIEADIDIASLGKWANEVRGHYFYIQTMSDLRLEPRWYPHYIDAEQLKPEFIGRISTVAHSNTSKIKAPSLIELLYGKSSDSIQSLMEFPFPFLPGPLEGSLESLNEPPSEVLEIIKKQLGEDNLKIKSFTALVNSALIYRIDSNHAQLAAKALRAVKHELRQTDNKEQVFVILQGLSTVAAVTRSKELADEIKILTRRCRLEPGNNLHASQALMVGLISAAAYSELRDWCKFVGEWVTELAFQSLEIDEMKILHLHIMQLCNITPELWITCGRAVAALSAVEYSN